MLEAIYKQNNLKEYTGDNEQLKQVKEAYESSRYRFEFMGNTQWDPKTSSFWGVAYDYQNREMKDNSADKDLSMVWGYFSLSHSF